MNDPAGQAIRGIGDAERRSAADPGVQRSYCNARSAFGARRRDAERMRRIARPLSRDMQERRLL